MDVTYLNYDRTFNVDLCEKCKINYRYHIIQAQKIESKKLFEDYLNLIFEKERK